MKIEVVSHDEPIEEIVEINENDIKVEVIDIDEQQICSEVYFVEMTFA